MQPQGKEQPEHRCRTKTCSRYYSVALIIVCACFLMAVVPQAEGQQMDPAAMQRQIQQQMGGSPGGGGGSPPPNRVGENKDIGLHWTDLASQHKTVQTVGRPPSYACKTLNM